MLSQERFIQGMEWAVDFAGEELREMRYNERMDIEKMGELSGLPLSRIDYVEQGKQPLDWEAICKIAAVFDKRTWVEFKDMSDDAD